MPNRTRLAEQMEDYYITYLLYLKNNNQVTSLKKVIGS